MSNELDPPAAAEAAWTEQQQQKKRADQNGLDPDPRAAIEVNDAGEIDITKIPPRGWLLGVSFCRKFISGLISEGGGGKTAIRYAQYLSVASARKLTGEHVHTRCRVLIVCLEDDLDEVRRRIGAAMLRHGIIPADVKGWLFYCSPRGLKLLQTDPRGVRTIGQLHGELQNIIGRLKIDLVGIDPFIKAHGVDENDNNAIDEVCIMLAEIGDEFNCAIDIVSHARKGQGAPGDADRDRGASSKRDAGRLMRTVTGMTAEMAELYKVTAADRTALIRVDDAKVNLTPRSSNTMWFRLVGVRLGNATALYPNGDSVQTVTRWYPTDIWAEITTAVANEILDQIDRGPREGQRYSATKQADATNRASWRVVQLRCPNLSEAQCKIVIAEWIKSGILESREHEDTYQRKMRVGLFVVKRPG
jgi:hypothetical protein